MARTAGTCPECGGEAASREAGCPRCGYIFQPVDQPEGSVHSGLAREAAAVDEPVRSKGTGWKSILAATCGCFALVALLGALVAWIVGRQMTGTIEQLARVQQQADMIALRRALEAYAEAHAGRYPQHLGELTQRNGDGPWIEVLPADRWGRPFVFEPPPGLERANGRGRLLTLGRDGAAGGEGADADLDEAAAGLNPR